MTRGVEVFGATGSIGCSTLAVLAAHPDQFRLEVISAHDNMDRLLDILKTHQPKHVVLTNPEHWETAKTHRHRFPQVIFHAGMSCLNELAQSPDVDIVVAGIVGAAGLRSTMAAVTAGKQVLLANKEALVMAGSFVMREAQRTGARILPLDSEHNAIFQCLPKGYQTGEYIQGLEQLILTCSGGPFRTLDAPRAQDGDTSHGMSTPQLEHGCKDFYRFSDTDE